MAEPTFDQLLARARALASRGPRAILGITGSPGAGKSTLAGRLVDALGPQVAVLVGMDGFHLANGVLDQMDARSRKGAPHTFDGAGFVALIRRLRDQPRAAAAGIDPVVYAPRFDRTIDESIGSAVPVRAEVPLVVTEGNYLLVDSPPWHELAGLLDETWFLDPPQLQRLDWLVARHEHFGRSPQAARDHALGSDQLNAEVVAATACRADLVVRAIL